MSLRPVIQWTKSPESDVAGYRIYYRTASQSYDSTRRVDIPEPCPNWYRMTQLKNWEINFVQMTAYDTSNNESNPSNEASVLVTGGLLMK